MDFNIRVPTHLVILLYGCIDYGTNFVLLYFLYRLRENLSTSCNYYAMSKKLCTVSQNR